MKTLFGLHVRAVFERPVESVFLLDQPINDPAIRFTRFT